MTKTGENKNETKCEDTETVYGVLHEGLINWVNFRLTKIIDNRLVRDELG
jgi:hypothetical protein